jgi:hypothetical protein
MSLEEKFKILQHTSAWGVYPEGLMKELAEAMSPLEVRFTNDTKIHPFIRIRALLRSHYNVRLSGSCREG